MKQIENSNRKADDLGSVRRGPNIRLPEWNKTERNTPGVSSPLLIIRHLQRSKRNDRSVFPSQMPAVTKNIPNLSEVIRTFTRAPSMDPQPRQLSEQIDLGLNPSARGAPTVL
jgi:hypothetical protein